VRRRNCGINGRPVLFYSRGHSQSKQTKSSRTTKPRPPASKLYADLIDGLAALGLTTTAAKVESALRAIYPGGPADRDQSEVLRAAFLHLKRQNSADSVGR